MKKLVSHILAMKIIRGCPKRRPQSEGVVQCGQGNQFFAILLYGRPLTDHEVKIYNLRTDKLL